MFFTWNQLKIIVLYWAVKTTGLRMRFQSLWFGGCLKTWFFWVGPPRGEQNPAPVTVILCDGSALTLWRPAKKGIFKKNT